MITQKYIMNMKKKYYHFIFFMSSTLKRCGVVVLIGGLKVKSAEQV